MFVSLQSIRDRLAPHLFKSGDIVHRISDDVAIFLPADHALPAYQAANPYYDRFLPKLASKLDAGSVVVDVGAKFICIEPDPVFFKYLARNTWSLKRAYPATTIETVRALVGQHISRANLVPGPMGGTKTMEPQQSAGMRSETLDTILERYRQHGPIRLIKIDIDGYDYDVIDSACRTVQADKPLIFFEVDLRNADQKYRFDDTIGRLSRSDGYDFLIFDNFGFPILQSADPYILSQLLDYTLAQAMNRTARTMYYYDILAFQKVDGGLVSALLRYFGPHMEDS